MLMKTFVLLLLTVCFVHAEDAPLCLQGQGPLQIGQYRCGEIGFISSSTDFGPLFKTVNYWDLIVNDLADMAAPLMSVQLETPNDWKTIFNTETSWTFRAEGKEYTLTGAQLMKAVKSAAGGGK